MGPGQTADGGICLRLRACEARESKGRREIIFFLFYISLCLERSGWLFFSSTDRFTGIFSACISGGRKGRLYIYISWARKGKERVDKCDLWGAFALIFEGVEFGFVLISD